MTEEMKEFRTQLSQMDGHNDELEYLTKQVDLEDSSLQMELEDAMYEMNRLITEIQESQGWI